MIALKLLRSTSSRQERESEPEGLAVDVNGWRPPQEPFRNEGLEDVEYSDLS